MGEPSSLVVRCRIGPDGLRRWLDSSEPVTTDFDDWGEFSANLDRQALAKLDRHAIRTGDVVAELRRCGVAPDDWTFAYDAESEMLTIGRVYFSDETQEIVTVLTVLRRLANAMTSEHEGGVIIVADWWWEADGPSAAVLLSPGDSRIVPAGELEIDVDELLGEVLNPIVGVLEQYDEATPPGPEFSMPDELEVWDRPS